MPFDKRKAYIEFLGQTAVRVVTPYRSKIFELDKRSCCAIDLISLKINKEIDNDCYNIDLSKFSNFCALFMYNQEKDLFYCTVRLRTGKDEFYFDDIGQCSLYDGENKQIFNVSVWVD